MNLFLAFAGAYLVGSLPTGWILVRLFKGVDIRRFGSGNIGMTNVWRVAGAPLALATLFLDASKGWLCAGFLPAWISAGRAGAVGCAAAVLIGNIFSIFLKGKGGKGVGVAAGVFLTLLPKATAAALLVFLLVLFMKKIVSLASLSAAAALALFSFVFYGVRVDAFFAAAVVLLVFWTHRKNIERLRAGTEPRLGRRASREEKR